MNFQNCTRTSWVDGLELLEKEEFLRHTFTAPINPVSVGINVQIN